MEIKKSAPIGEGLFAWPTNEPSLIAIHCKSCGDYFFPKTFTCRNPECKEKNIEEVTLGRTGRLLSYTILHYPPPPPFVISGTYEPTPIAEVEMSEGIRILGIMANTKPENINIGIQLELIFDKIYEDENGIEIIGWKFRPV